MTEHWVDSRVQQTIKLLDAILPDSRLTVVRIAREVHLSPSRLRYLMQIHLGQSPKQYILMKRLLRAEEMLLKSCLSIKEVMAAVGMSDPTHFGREFKKMFGMSPREYRRQQRNMSFDG